MGAADTTTTRRLFLASGSAAAVFSALSVAARDADAVPHVPADPLHDLVTIYRDEDAWLETLDGEKLDEVPLPVWDALNTGPLPMATSREGAVAALRLAVEMSQDFSGVDAVPNLVRAALGFLEGAGA